MKQFFYLFMGVLMIMTWSCHKTEVIEPDIIAESPVFYCKWNIDNASFNMTAGINDYYMYSSYSQDTGGLYAFTGTLKQVNCSTNCNAMTFQLNDNKKSVIGASSSIDSLTPGTYQYMTDSVVSSRLIQFYSGFVATSTPVSFNWDFGDGSTSTLQTPTHAYLSEGTYNVCLTISFSNGCTSSLCNEVKVTSAPECKAHFDYKESSDTTFFTPIATGNSPTYYWDFGDTNSIKNNTSYLKNPIHIFSKPGIYKVMLETTTKDNCKNRVFQYVRSPKYVADCMTDFSYSKVKAIYHFSEVTVIYKNKDDMVFSSARVTQPSDSYFEVISIEEYQLNENNQKTKKIHARFKCNVSDGTHVISIANGDAVFAVAYP